MDAPVLGTVHAGLVPGDPDSDPIFRPLRFRNLTVKNRIFRANISGRIDNYDGSGTQARINWEERFARNGVGAILSAHVPVHVRGRVLPNYAFIDDDRRIPFWRRVGEAVHAHGCAFVLQLSHAGRQQDIKGIENFGRRALSSTNRPDPFHGFVCRQATRREIREIVDQFARGAHRAREAGLDGVEIHAANGYLFTQFLSPGINRRRDAYGGPLENRARLLLDVVRAVRREVGPDYHLQVKLSAADHHDAFLFWKRRGTTVEESVRVCRWLEREGVDAIHVSTGGMFLHPLNPPGPFPVVDGARVYGTMLSEGRHTFRNYLVFRYRPLQAAFLRLWGFEARRRPIEGISLDEAREIKRNVGIPVISTGGFQTASVIRRAIAGGACDAVSIARPLIANPDLVRVFASGRDRADRPCTYCNRCLVNVIKHPLGCYDLSRYDGDRDRMIAEVMSIFEPDGFSHGAGAAP